MTKKEVLEFLFRNEQGEFDPGLIAEYIGVDIEIFRWELEQVAKGFEEMEEDVNGRQNNQKLH